MKTLKISIDGLFHILDLIEEEDLHDQYDFQGSRCLEIHELKCGDEICIYGKDFGSDFNKYDLQSTVARGSIFITKTDMYGNLKDINETEFLNYYEDSEELDDYIIEDELEISENEYDYSDGFLIRDDDIESFGEYLREHEH